MRTRAFHSVFVFPMLAVSAMLAPSVSAQTPNYIQVENAKPGATDWKLTNPGYATGTIEGYASATSVNRGGSIGIFVNTIESSYTMAIYRMGYYGGAGARKMLTVSLAGIAQPSCPMNALGTVDCRWINPYVLNIPNSADPTDWMSGIYLVKLTTGTTHTQQYAIFAVRDDARYSNILMIQSVNTYEAYNVWGGKSLYGTISNSSDTANKAEKVSFNRPYYANGSYGTSDFFGGLYTGNELGMLTWLEQHGYDVTYATDPDLDSNPSIALNHKMVEIVGHTEYWSWGMRDAIQNAIGAGVNFASFAGNVSFWQIRYEASLVTGDPYRTIVGYKEHVALDPLGTTKYATTEWRYAPVNRPEDLMTGTMFVTKGRPLLCVEDESSWVLTGTGLKNGQCFGNPDGSGFLGPELDYLGPDAPADIQRVGHSPAASDLANFSDMTVYRASSGATVFSSGSIGWSETVPSAVQILENVLSRMLTGAFADTTPIRPTLPSPFQAKDIGPVGRAGFVSLVGPASFTMNGDGQASFSGQDAMFFVYQAWTGDGQMTVRLNHLQELWGSQAGVMIRESLDPTAKDVSLAGRSSEGVVEGADLRAKSSPGGTPGTLASVNFTMPNWLRLVRIGNTFYGLVSADGVNWGQIGSVSVPMASSVYVGAFINPDQHNVWQTADFDHVTVSTDTTLPAAAASSAALASLPTTPTVASSSMGGAACTTPDPFLSIGGGTCVNGGWIPGVSTSTSSDLGLDSSPTTGSPTSTVSASSCTTPDPFVSIGGGTCVNGGWIPGGMTSASSAASTPTTTASAPTTAAGCTTPDPFVSIGGGTCVNGGWIPGGMTSASTPASAPSTSAPVPTTSVSTGCTIPDPFVSIGGGTCVNGGWIPGHAATTSAPASTSVSTSTTSTTSSTPAASSCTIPDPFVSIGGGTCVNGGWIPGHVTTASPAASTAASTSTPSTTSSTAAASRCTIPDPFVSIGGGTCINGGWVPGHVTTATPTSSTGTTSTPTSGGCTIPDPFVSIGGGICVNGGWVPKG